MAENEKRDNENQGDGFTTIWNFRTNNPLDRKQPFYSFNEAQDIPLHQIFREFIWWCDENDPVYQKIERQYRYHMIRVQKNKSNPSTEPQYTALENVDEKDLYDKLDEEAKIIVYDASYTDIEDYVSPNNNILTPEHTHFS